MSTVVTENLKRSSETASRSLRGVAAAWVNFNGTGTVAIRDSENTSSLVDNGTGSYNVLLSSALEATDYAIAGSSNGSVGIVVTGDAGFARTSSQYRLINVIGNTGAAADASVINATVDGDLA